MGIQEMLKAEMDEHLGYEKHAPESVQYSNSRNGHSYKKVKSKLGEIPLEVPRTGKEALNLSWYLNAAV